MFIGDYEIRFDPEWGGWPKFIRKWIDARDEEFRRKTEFAPGYRALEVRDAGGYLSSRTVLFYGPLMLEGYSVYGDDLSTLYKESWRRYDGRVDAVDVVSDAPMPAYGRALDRRL